MSTTTKHDHDLYPGENVAILTPAPIDDAFGFYGTVKAMVGDEEIAIRLWASASLTLSTAFREDDPAVVRNFLRSRYGRHLADHITFFARPVNYSDASIMSNAVQNAILDQFDAGRNKGKNIWQTCFEEIRKITLNGEWQD